MDELDAKILAERQAAFLRRRDGEIKSGDFVHFADGTMSRVTHVWSDERGPFSIQTEQGNGDSSFYLGNGYMEFSGSLRPGVSFSFMKPAGWTTPGSCWFFHHDHARAYNGVRVKVDCPVWNCSLSAEEARS